MKALSIALSLFFVSVAYGNSGSIPQDQMSNYALAVSDSLNAHELKCSLSENPMEFVSMIRSASSGTFDTNGNQPRLSFNCVNTDNLQTNIRITTSDDNKTIVAIDADYLVLQKVNEGTVVEPKYAWQWTKYSTTSCK